MNATPDETCIATDCGWLRVSIERARELCSDEVIDESVEAELDILRDSADESEFTEDGDFLGEVTALSLICAKAVYGAHRIVHVIGPVVTGERRRIVGVIETRDVVHTAEYESIRLGLWLREHFGIDAVVINDNSVMCKRARELLGALGNENLVRWRRRGAVAVAHGLQIEHATRVIPASEEISCPMLDSQLIETVDARAARIADEGACEAAAQRPRDAVDVLDERARMNGEAAAEREQLLRIGGADFSTAGGGYSSPPAR